MRRIKVSLQSLAFFAMRFSIQRGVCDHHHKLSFVALVSKYSALCPEKKVGLQLA
jgi:hypothetical protein